jgi:hypothetical protein
MSLRYCRPQPPTPLPQYLPRLSSSPEFARPRIYSLGYLALIAALVSAFAVRPAAALQGMASGRVARPRVQGKTDKPPNEVHFEDVSEKAGRSAG